MNSSRETINVSELVKTLTEINNCPNTKTEYYADETSSSYPCCMESMCDSCIDKFAGLLEWAEDYDNDKTDSQPTN